MRHSVILIPSLNPGSELISYVEELTGQGFLHIIVVNDGSSQEYSRIFEALREMGCIILRHAANYGKGRALKNGLNEFLNRFGEAEEICGIITADSDGQHLVKDIVRMDESLWEAGREKERLILGVRNFDQADVPFKSRFGNKATCFFFRLLYGFSISDTQTGLRGITTGCVRNFLALKGERFEYETSMLIAAVRNKIVTKELPIETVYVDGNGGTHFRPVQDSAIIYAMILGGFLKYTISSLSASAIDITLFHFLVLWMPGTRGIWVATVFARAISSFYNYSMNKMIVFWGSGRMAQSLWRYYALCVGQGACSAALVSWLSGAVPVTETWCKVVVDTVLFFLSYQIQRRFVFRTCDGDKLE